MNALRNQPVLLAYAFRPFFLLASICAVAVMLAWLVFLFAGADWMPTALPLAWHGHEMIFGLVPAAICGFLLTAITNWTKTRPVKGAWLLALVGLWVLGRVGMWSMASWPGAVVAAVDVAFLVIVSLYAFAVLIQHRNHRNLVLAAAIGVMALGNGLMHAGFMVQRTDLAAMGLQVGMDSLTLVVAVIAGRITPAFSRNWLRQQGGRADAIDMNPRLSLWSLISIACVLPMAFIWPHSVQTSVVILLAAAINSWRLWGWRGWLVAREPLLWILHLAYLWLIFALILRGLAGLGAPWPGTLWLHAFGVGAIGVLLLGVMTRVALGHTGRPLQLPNGAIWIYVAINLAAILRLVTASGWLSFSIGVPLAAAAWIIAFALYFLLYIPILTSPRPDGRPG